MWAELQGWEGDSTLLLGDGSESSRPPPSAHPFLATLTLILTALAVSVQPSTVTSCLGGPGSESFEGDPSVVQLGQTLLATITTTISLDPSSTIVSSPSSSAATSPTSVPASRISTTARPKSSSRISARPGRPSASSPAPDLGANTSAPTAPKTGTHPAVIAASVIISVVGFAAIAGTYFLLRRMRRNIAKDADCRGGAEHGMAPGAVHGSGGGAGGGMTMLGSSSTASLPATVGVAGAGGHVSMADLPALNLVQPFTYSAPSTPVAGSGESCLHSAYRALDYSRATDLTVLPFQPRPLRPPTFRHLCRSDSTPLHPSPPRTASPRTPFFKSSTLAISRAFSRWMKTTVKAAVVATRLLQGGRGSRRPIGPYVIVRPVKICSQFD